MPFAPAADINLSTPAPKAPPAITSIVSLPSGSDNVKSLSVVFPPAFAFNQDFHPVRCQPADEAARACPAASKIGTVNAESIAPATGEAYISQDFRLILFASALGGAIQLKVVAAITIDKASGGFKLDFTGLPDLPLAKLTLALDGGNLALARNPAKCGTYSLPMHFVAQTGATADATPKVTISGCPPVIGITSPRAKVAGRTVTLRWGATAATQRTRVAVQQLGKGRFHTVTTRTVSAHKLTLHGLKGGNYRARLRALAGSRSSAARWVSFRVGA